MSTPDRYRLKPKHWRGTDGATEVETDSLVEAQIAVDHAIIDCGIVGLDGRPGTGRSFALKTIIEDLVVPYWYLPIGPDSTGKGFETGLLQAIYATKSPPRHVDGTRLRSDLRWDLWEELSARPCVVFVDDFSVSGLKGTQVIHWLFEQADLKAAFVLAGNDLDSLLRHNPAFHSRVMRMVPFARIPEADIVEKIGAYHPFLERSKPDLLRVDRAFAQGNFRNWAIFLEAALKLAAEEDVDRLTDEVIDAAYVAINKATYRIEDEEP
jgi:hypothetical protein